MIEELSFLINLSDREKFVNAISEIAEGNIHWENVNYNLVGDYSKSVNCGDMDTVIFYDVAHEKQLQRESLFMHLVTPFWATYDEKHTKLPSNEKYLIFLKLMRECKNVYPLETLEEIKFAMEAKLNLSAKELERLNNGKMWHDFHFLPHYQNYALPLLKKDSKGFYW